MPSGFARKPKTVLGSKDWLKLKAKLKKVFPSFWTLVETDAGLRDVSNTDFRSHRPQRATPEAIKLMVGAHESGGEPDLRLRLAARRLWVTNPDKRITALSLAKELGISRAGLYRHYDPDKINMAMQEAEQPVRIVEEEDEEETKEESLHTELANMFAALAGYDERGREVDNSDEISKPAPKRGKTAS